jgi:putative acetyltransferase
MAYENRDSDCGIRPIAVADNPAVARIIRQVMTEFGAVGENYSISDPEVDAMFEAYPAPGAAFFVVERAGRILGCGGMGPLARGPGAVCELRKMYFLPELRGTGIGAQLLTIILRAARRAGYRRCYLETLGRMHQARRLYRRNGFEEIAAPMGDTGHSGCNSWMVRDL